MKISQLPEEQSLDGTESLPFVKAGVTKRGLMASFAALLVPLLTGLAKGDPGGNVSAIGLFTAAGTLSVPVGTDLVRTSGYYVRGRGMAEYVEFDEGDIASNDGYVAVNPRAAFKSANNRYFRLNPGDALKLSMFGAIADGSAAGGTDNTDVINYADAYCAAHQVATLIFDGNYHIAGQILHSDNLTWRGDHATVWMGRTGTNAAKDESASLRSRVHEAYFDFYVDEPGGFAPANIGQSCRLDGEFHFRWTDAGETFARANIPDTRMCVAYYTCHDLYVGPNVRFDCGWMDWTFTHFGDRLFWNFAEIHDGENRPIYADGYHSIGGDDGNLFSNHMSAGDDALSFAWNFDSSCKGWTIRAKVYSRIASGCKLAVGRIGSTANYANALTGRIEDFDIEITWLPLGPSRNSYFRWDCALEHYDNDAGEWEARAESADLIRNNKIKVLGFGKNDGLPAGDTGLSGATPGQPAISFVGGENNTVTAEIRHPSLWSVYMQGIGAGNHFDIDSPDPQNWSGGGGNTARAWEVLPIYRIETTGGVIANTTTIFRKSKGFTFNSRIAGGARGNFRFIDLDGDLVADQIEASEIPNGYNAVELLVNDLAAPLISRLVVNNYCYLSTTAGGTPRGFLGNAQYSEFYINNLHAPDPIRIVDLVTVFPKFRATYHPLHYQVRQIASGAINSFGAGRIRVQSRNVGQSDSLAAVANMIEGQDEILIADDPANEPITVTAVSPSRTLNSNTSELLLAKSGAAYTDRSYRP